MCEVEEEANYVKHHKKKIAFIMTSVFQLKRTADISINNFKGTGKISLLSRFLTNINFLIISLKHYNQIKIAHSLNPLF